MSAEWPLVKPGAKGPRVKALQRLQELVKVPADGVFGPATAKAVRAFQERVHLGADGVAGPHTWQLLIVEH